jgi:hypothetical protein
VDEIKDPTPCTLLYVKGRISTTIEVVEATVIPSRILHGRPIPVECAVVKVTTIREGHEFDDLDYPNEEEGIEKPVDGKGTFILWPCKDIIVKTCSSSIVSPRSTEAGGTPTSNMPMHGQDPHTSTTPPLLKTLQTQSSRRAWGKGHLLLLLETESSRTTRRLGHLPLLLKT